MASVRLSQYILSRNWLDDKRVVYVFAAEILFAAHSSKFCAEKIFELLAIIATKTATR